MLNDAPKGEPPQRKTSVLSFETRGLIISAVIILVINLFRYFRATHWRLR